MVQRYEEKIFIGIDVSKKTFDAVIYNEKAVKPCECRHNKFFNGEEGFTSFLSWAVSDMHVRRSRVVVGMEDTGIYHILKTEKPRIGTQNELFYKTLINSKL